MAEHNIKFCIVFDSTKKFMHIFVSHQTFNAFFKPFFLAHNFNHDKCKCCTSFNYSKTKNYDILFKKKNNNCTIVFVILHKIPQGFRYFFADFYMHYYFLPCYILKEKNLYKSNHISPSIICKLL